MEQSTPTVVDRWSARELVGPLAVLAGTTVVLAVPYWSAGYDTVRDDGLFGSWLLVEVVLVLGSFLAGAVSEAPLPAVAVGMLGCAPVVVLGRVLVDTATRPTSHDLWPLEVVLAVAMSIPAVGVGVTLAWGVRRLAPRRR